MDVQYLPLEHPSTYTRVRNALVGALVPGLQSVLELQWDALPPKGDPQRIKTLTGLLLRHRERLLQAVFANLDPVSKNGSNEWERSTHKQSVQRDGADTLWELLVWLIEGLLQRDFPGRKVSLADRQGAPFFLYQVARKLAGVDTWNTKDVTNCLQQVLYELSAEHTSWRLQCYYGAGGDYAVNRILKVLRPVDPHANRALGLLANPVGLEPAVVLVLACAYGDEVFRVRQATERRIPMPAPWLMNWTDEFHTIQGLMKAALTVTASVTARKRSTLRAADDSFEPADGEALTPLSTNTDVYLRKNRQVNRSATEQKIAGALLQLHELRQMGSANASRVELGELLDRLNQDEHSGDDLALGTSVLPGEPGAALVPDGHPLAAVLECLDAEKTPLVRVAALLRLCARLPDKQERVALYEDLVPFWEEQGIFERVGIKPGIVELTEQRMALASAMPLADFALQVGAALQRFDEAAALAAEASDAVHGALRRLHSPWVRVAVALRLLRRLPTAAQREERARVLYEAWNDPDRFDGGLFAAVGLPPAKEPDNLNEPWADAALDALTDEVLALGDEVEPSEFEQQVAQALAQFDEVHAPAARSRQKGRSGQGVKP